MLKDDADIEAPLKIAHDVANGDDFQFIGYLIVVIFFVGVIGEEELWEVGCLGFGEGLISGGGFGSESSDWGLIFFVDGDESDGMHGYVGITQFVELLNELADGFGAQMNGTLICHIFQINLTNLLFKNEGVQINFEMV